MEKRPEILSGSSFNSLVSLFLKSDKIVSRSPRMLSRKEVPLLVQNGSGVNLELQKDLFTYRSMHFSRNVFYIVRYYF